VTTWFNKIKVQLACHIRLN